ncbi:MAG: hypothetical protein WCZ66_10735 [Sphingomonadaceae bacterium]
MTLPPFHDFDILREVVAAFQPAPSVQPNETISLERVFTPESHRAVLDLGRQLIVGNRGMGKSLWAHALSNPEVRQRVSDIYRQPALAHTEVVIGFNGSDRPSPVAPTREAIGRAIGNGFSEDEIWRAVVFRAIRVISGSSEDTLFESSLQRLRRAPELFENTLLDADDRLRAEDRKVLILFDALDRLADDWRSIRALTSSLMKRALGLRSFVSFRAKIFIRPDQFSDPEIFRFPDGSKLKNDHVDLSWQPHELYGLLFFEMLHDPGAHTAMFNLAASLEAEAALSPEGLRSRRAQQQQIEIVNALAGPFMGSDARRGRVYTWIPLHLSDARNSCSPRTFLTAWQEAALHDPAPNDRMVNHLGLIEGVRRASTARLNELREDYRWIDEALGALRGQFVPITKEELFDIWAEQRVVTKILENESRGISQAPVGLIDGPDALQQLLAAMKGIAVVEERTNGKINVPDIFRVEAGIKRKGGVAVPRRQ